jgi:hypothetical protein
MQGNERQRFCTRCRQQVYNIAEMNRDEAMALVNSEGRVCVRIYRRPDGTVLTRDCRQIVRAARRIFAAGVAAVGALVLALLGSVGFASMQRFRFGQREMLQGEPRMGDVMLQGKPVQSPQIHIKMGEICLPAARPPQPPVKAP